MIVGVRLVVTVRPEEQVAVMKGVPSCQVLMTEGDALQPDRPETCRRKQNPDPSEEMDGANAAVPIQGWHRQISIVGTG